MIGNRRAERTTTIRTGHNDAAAEEGRGTRNIGRGATTTRAAAARGAGRRARSGGRGTTGGKRQTMAWGDDEAGGSGAGRGTAKDELPKGGEGRGNKPLINRFQGYHRTGILATEGGGSAISSEIVPLHYARCV